MVKVSVIIPCYNTEKWLPDCLDSVLSQTLPEIEAICVDDASPDGCARIMDEYAARDPRVKTIHLPENHKQGYGRNRGMEIAQGEFIYLLDSDDMIEPDALERLYALAEADRLDGIFFNARIIHDSEDLRKKFPSELHERKGSYPDEVVSGAELYRLFLTQNDWRVYVQEQFWRRSFLREHDIWFPEGIEHEDQLFSFEAVLAAGRVRYRDWKLFIRRYRPDSVMTKELAWVNFHGYFVNIWKMIDVVRDAGLEEDPVVRQSLLDLINYMKSIYLKYRDEPDLELRFGPQGLEKEFLLYRWLFDAEYRRIEERQARESRFWEPIAGYTDLTIYGAGKIGQSVFRRLGEIRIAADRFAVTDPESAPAFVGNRRVVGPDEIPKKENAAVLVAMAAVHHEEVAEILRERGLTYFLYARGVLRGPFPQE